MDDPATARASFSVVQNLNAEVMTFSFDMVEPIVESAPTRMEVILRAGIGTAHNTLQSRRSCRRGHYFPRDAPTRGACTSTTAMKHFPGGEQQEHGLDVPESH